MKKFYSDKDVGLTILNVLIGGYQGMQIQKRMQTRDMLLFFPHYAA
jgi:hypothetical protein